jgi:hypothetical protein
LLIRLTYLLLLFTGAAYSAENLVQNEYAGDWKQVHQITDGEIGTLVITNDFVVKFTRTFSIGYPEQAFTTDPGGLKFVRDLALVELRRNDVHVSSRQAIQWASGRIQGGDYVNCPFWPEAAGRDFRW